MKNFCIKNRKNQNVAPPRGVGWGVHRHSLKERAVAVGELAHCCSPNERAVTVAELARGRVAAAPPGECAATAVSDPEPPSWARYEV
jgi:hypothetical protein